jgi:predicted transcriptional regulator
MSREDDSLEDLKYILGNMGIDILISIAKGAKDIETIKLFSGIPISCIKGRLPVLLDLNLIKKKDDEYFLVDKGINFKNKLQKENQL